MTQSYLKIQEAEKIIVTVITDNYTDALKPHHKIARRPVSKVSPKETIFHAEHGLAYHVETVVNNQSHCFLFDFGFDFHGIKRNLDLLKVKLNSIEALALSHDHFDHQSALLELLNTERGNIRQGIPFYIGENFFTGTAMRTTDGNIVSLSALKREDIEELGLVKIVEVKAPTPIVQGAYLTGSIKRITDYEQIPPAFVVKKGESFVQEDFNGEQAIVSIVKGKGLVVLSACAHRGIVNTVKHAQKITGIDKVHAVIGGFHLTGAKTEIIQKTIEGIKDIRPDYIVPTHCTGFEAVSAFAREMSDQFILNTAGTRYTMAG